MNNKEKQIREEFKKLVVMGNHVGESYEKALKKERLVNKATGRFLCLDCNKEFTKGEFEAANNYDCPKCGITFEQLAYEQPHHIGEYKEITKKEYKPFKITIGRVMQALDNTAKNRKYDAFLLGANGIIYELNLELEKFCEWKLTKENSQECTDDDQSIETITKLLTLLKK